MNLHENEFKFTIWYDNEWSYAAQMIKMVKVMYNKNNQVDFGVTLIQVVASASELNPQASPTPVPKIETKKVTKTDT